MYSRWAVATVICIPEVRHTRCEQRVFHSNDHCMRLAYVLRASCARIRGWSRLVLVVRKICFLNDTQTLFCRAAMLPDKSACSRKATPPLHLPPHPASHSRMMHPRTPLPLLFPVRPFSTRFPKRPRALPSMAIQSKARPKARINGNLVKETS